MKFYQIAISIFVLIGLLQILFLRFFAKEWWETKKIRHISIALPLVRTILFLLWFASIKLNIQFIAIPSAGFGVLLLIFELALIIAYPFTGFVNFVNYLFDRFQNDSAEKDVTIDSTRRKVLKSVATSIPIVSLASGATGVMQTFSSVDVYKKQIQFDNLPDDLHGFRILHLSDLHLKHYVTLDDLSDVLLDAEKFSPDMVVVTGDIADDLDMLPDALKLISQLKAPYGAFASLGNHEYFRGVGIVKHLFEKSSIPLFVNQGETIQVRNSSIFIGGIDDPVRMGAKETQFFKQTIDKTLNHNARADFKVLMSHRPDALDYASETGIDLTLAGHTHGGQIGINGRSLFESDFPDRYLWGDYSIGKSKLYTSSGMGHWFPFRLGCPAEAPVIELVKS